MPKRTDEPFRNMSGNYYKKNRCEGKPELEKNKQDDLNKPGDL